MEMIPVLMLVSGVTLLYAAIKNKNPLDLVKAVATGKPIEEVKPIDNGAGGLDQSLKDALIPPVTGNVQNASAGGTPGAVPAGAGTAAVKRGQAPNTPITQGRVGGGSGTRGPV